MEPSACSSEKKCTAGAARSTSGRKKSSGGLEEEKKAEDEMEKVEGLINAEGKERRHSGPFTESEVNCTVQSEGVSVCKDSTTKEGVSRGKAESWAVNCCEANSDGSEDDKKEETGPQVAGGVKDGSVGSCASMGK